MDRDNISRNLQPGSTTLVTPANAHSEVAALGLVPRQPEIMAEAVTVCDTATIKADTYMHG